MTVKKTKTRKLQCLAVWETIGRESLWRLIAQCTQCGKINSHGGGTGKNPRGGNRSAHCACHDNYDLVVVLMVKDNKVTPKRCINDKRKFGVEFP